MRRKTATAPHPEADTSWYLLQQYVLAQRTCVPCGSDSLSAILARDPRIVGRNHLAFSNLEGVEQGSVEEHPCEVPKDEGKRSRSGGVHGAEPPLMVTSVARVFDPSA